MAVEVFGMAGVPEDLVAEKMAAKGEARADSCREVHGAGACVHASALSHVCMWHMHACMHVCLPACALGPMRAHDLLR